MIRRNYVDVIAAAAAVVIVGWSSCVRAQTTDREKVLEDRINYLEERLRQVEERLSKRVPYRHAAQPSAGAPLANARAPVPGVETVARATYSTAKTPPASTPVAASSSDRTAADNTRPAAVEPENAPQELNVLRENAVTLKPSGLEVSTEIDYLRRETQLQNDRAFIATSTLRYGVFDWLELSTSLPAGYSVRTTNTSPTASVTRYHGGIGDLSAQGNARIVNETVNWPGVVVSLGFVAPTGSNPYYLTNYRFNFAGIATPNPRNPLIDYFSLGSWGLHSNVQIYKTVDPIILFAGFGFDHVFPLTSDGFTIDGFNRLSYNFGMSFALSEKTTLGFSVNGAYSPNIKVNGHEVFQTALEPMLARFSVIQRIMKNVWFEPSISFGMDQDSPDFGVGFGIRARF